LLSSLLQCTAFVKEFAPEIIQLVDQVIDPDTICKVNTIIANNYLRVVYNFTVIRMFNTIFQDLKLCTEKESPLLAPWKKLARAKSF
jgi:hypothetical protein